MIETVAPLAVFVAFVGLVYGAALVRAARARQSQLRRPRYWGR